MSDTVSAILKHQPHRMENHLIYPDDAITLLKKLQEANVPTTSLEEIKLNIFGMTCTSCSSAIEDNIGLVDGVHSCKVNLALEYAIIVYDKQSTGPRQLIHHIEDMGFDALLSANEDVQVQHLNKSKDIADIKKRFKQSLLYSVPNLILMFFHGPFIGPFHLSHLLQCVFATMAIFTVGKPFYMHAYKGLLHNSFTMDTLVSLGTLSAYLFSLFMMVHHFFHKDHVILFFDTTTMLITFILLGKYLETNAKAKTSASLSRLCELKPDKATLANGDVIDAQLLELNDVLLVKSGAKIPADGLVIKGTSTVDESLLTGESLPIPKTINDTVVAGSVNISDPIEIKVTAVGSDTTLQRIIQLVSKAQANKAPIEYVSDAIASIFVPTVVLLALFTFLLWFMILTFATPSESFFDKLHITQQDSIFLCFKICISVIVIACPCTLGLATPTAVMVGTGKGAELGILIKGGSSLEHCQNISTIVFDKTGTLTQGTMKVINFTSTTDIWSILLAIETQSEHPIARAIVQYAESLDLSPSTIYNYKTTPGYGVSACCNEDAILVGSDRFMRDHQLEVPFDEFTSHACSLGYTCVYIAINQQVVGVVSIGDELKPYAKETIFHLQKMGIKTIMCTGDNRRTAQVVAKDLNIEVYAEMTPMQKGELIKRLKKAKCKRTPHVFDRLMHHFREDQWDRQVVAFCGDGVNDAIALAESDVAIALGNGSDIAMDTSDIVLMKNDLLDIVISIDLSRRIFERIKLNFLWALLYNIVSIPLAMGIGIPFGVMLHPMIAGAAMACSSVSVVLSSLMLKWYRVPEWIRQLRMEHDDSWMGWFRRGSDYVPLQ